MSDARALVVRGQMERLTVEERVTSGRSTKLQVFRGLHGYLMGKRQPSCRPSRRALRDMRETRRRQLASLRDQCVELYRSHGISGMRVPRFKLVGGFALRSKRLRKKAGLR